MKLVPQEEKIGFPGFMTKIDLCHWKGLKRPFQWYRDHSDRSENEKVVAF